MTLETDVEAEVAEGLAFVASAPKLMQILEAVCTAYKAGKMDMMSRRRYTHLVDARDGFYWLARSLTPRTYVEIGQFLDMRDHTSVWEGVARVEKRMSKHRARLLRAINILGIDPDTIGNTP